MLAVLHSLGMFIVDLFKSRRRLEAENLFLRRQLSIALRRAPRRLRLRGSDRALSRSLVCRALPAAANPGGRIPPQRIAQALWAGCDPAPGLLQLQPPQSRLGAAIMNHQDRRNYVDLSLETF